MRRWALALMLLLASGCMDDPQTRPASTVSPATGTPTSLGPASGTSAPMGPPPEQTTWYLHVDLGCQREEPFCNCGNVVKAMDQNRTDSDCDGHGQGGPRGVVPSDCKDECFPATDAMPAYPAGTPAHGTIYLTTDAVESMSVTVQLLSGEEPVGSGTSAEVQVVGAGGFAGYTAVPFNFTLEKGMRAGAPFELRLEVHYTQAYFVGYAGDHRSHVILG